jgi:hypothetical protein
MLGNTGSAALTFEDSGKKIAARLPTFKPSPSSDLEHWRHENTATYQKSASAKNFSRR